MKVLITAPSLNPKENVSGISTVVRQIMERGTADYRHFTAGRRDGEAAGAGWLVRQAAMPISFLREIIRYRPDVVHVNTALTELSILRDAALVLTARIARRPCVVAVHGGRYLLEEFRGRAVRAAAASVSKKAAVVLVLSELEKQQIEKRWKGINVRVLPNAVPRMEIERATPGGRPVLLFLGRLHESKGLSEIVTTTKALKASGFDLEFRTYGDGPARDSFVSDMRDALGQDFVYGGVISGVEKHDALAAADILVLPSRYGEGLPMSMLEAMAAGCIVVAGEMASVASVIDNRLNGYTVRPGDAANLTETLAEILKDTSTWPAVRQNAVKTVRERFDIADYIDQLEGIYREVSK